MATSGKRTRLEVSGEGDSEAPGCIVRSSTGPDWVVDAPLPPRQANLSTLPPIHATHAVIRINATSEPVPSGEGIEPTYCEGNEPTEPAALSATPALAPLAAREAALAMACGTIEPLPAIPEHAATQSGKITADDGVVSFPPQFPLASGGSPLARLQLALAPCFADSHFEQRYRTQRGRGMDVVQRNFSLAILAYCGALWGYHLTSADGLDRQAWTGLLLMHAALALALAFWAVLRCAPHAARHSSPIQAAQCAAITSLFCWGLPATGRETCSDLYNTHDANLQQTIFVAVCFAAVFCRIGAGSFLALCLSVLFNFLVSQSAWNTISNDTVSFNAAFEAPKLLTILLILFSGVVRNDLHLRRVFAARELMLMLIEEQRQAIDEPQSKAR